MKSKKDINVTNASTLTLREKLTMDEKNKMKKDGSVYKYFEIGDVTPYGLIVKHIEDEFEMLPSRGEYVIHKGDILLALNNSSRGTVVLVPDEYDGAICTSGFLVITPRDEEEGLLLWYSLRSEVCRKQIYYLAQTASQPELKIEAWKKYFKIPFPIDNKKDVALRKAKEFNAHISKLIDINKYCFNL